MSQFAYRNGALHAEGVALAEIADQVGTPVYVYSESALNMAYRAIADALAPHGAAVHYAIKANDNLAVLRVLADLGAGADVVSEGEMRRAMAAGIPASKIVFSGVGKTAAELRAGLLAGIQLFNVESLPELELLAREAASLGVTAPVALRVNPDVDAETHDKIATGRHHDKFGIDIDQAGAAADRAAALPSLSLRGLAVHIGSQITSLAPYRAAFTRLAALVDELRAAGHTIETLDLGGGLGIQYNEETPLDPAAYGALIGEVLGGSGCALLVEPGRAIAGPAGVLLTEIIYVKHTRTRRFVIVDAAMNDLLRPTLYDARHRIVPLIETATAADAEPADIVGPVCETGDFLARDVELPMLDAGARLAVLTAGAYGAVMASSYNARPLVPEVLVKDNAFAVIRPRPTFEETMADQHMPPWMDGVAGRRATNLG